MEGSIRGLPPLKRFKLLQQQEDESGHSSSRLPAKKRKESWDPPILPSTTVSCCLPAKKRVWAPQPLSPQKPSSSFDLNVEYKPSPEKKPSTVAVDYEENAAKEENQDTSEGIHEEEEYEDGIVCDICLSTDGDPSDPIVFCDGCDLMVHATCYGKPLIQGIPEGEWFCARCEISSPSRKVAADEGNVDFCCCLCPIKGGAMKPTTDGRCAHIICALLVPEVFFKDPVGRDGIDCSQVPSRRWKGKCYLCQSASGCVIECSEPKCLLAFHVSCGLKEDLCIEYREGRSGGAIVAGFCKTHTELWKKQQQSGKFKIVAREQQRK
ncbi:protein Jade-1 [Macadamia integrifolia]|uniref:protein Jade-1 n=1 Tax=Macadamia integrifolia TaxID=60698 RepID=UPI001C52CE80|nr:protein Jade-1 [Macadamia integrifolia]